MAFNISWTKVLPAAALAIGVGATALAYKPEAQARLPPTRQLRFPPR